MSCAKKKKEIPIQLLSASTPEGKMEYTRIVVFHAMSAASQHTANREDRWLCSVARQTNDANQTKQHLHILLRSSNI